MLVDAGLVNTWAAGAQGATSHMGYRSQRPLSTSSLKGFCSAKAVVVYVPEETSNYRPSSCSFR
jgi:hypothetical protein